MMFNDVDIYSCKFFTVNEDKKLEFYSGKYKGKTIDDFKDIQELKKVIAYCFWILQKEDIPKVSKYTASAFLKALTPKFFELEKIVRKMAVDEQARLKKKTKELTKTVGKKYA